MDKRNNHTDASDGSLSDAMSEHELEELEVQVSSSPTRTPTPTNRKKTPNKEGYRLADSVADDSDEEIADPNERKKHTMKTTKNHAGSDKAKSKSVSMKIDDGDTVEEPEKSTHKKSKTPARSGRGVAQFIEKKKAFPEAKPVTTKASPPKETNMEERNMDIDDKPSSSPSKGAAVLQMTTKISKLAEDAFEVAETWEGWLARFKPKEEGAIKKVQMAMDKIVGKRKADVGGNEDEEDEGKRKGGSGRKRAKRKASR
jgi:hypothetical protein